MLVDQPEWGPVLGLLVSAFWMSGSVVLSRVSLHKSGRWPRSIALDPFSPAGKVLCYLQGSGEVGMQEHVASEPWLTQRQPMSCTSTADQCMMNANLQQAVSLNRLVCSRKDNLKYRRARRCTYIGSRNPTCLRHLFPKLMTLADSSSSHSTTRLRL